MSPEAYARHLFSKSVNSDLDLIWVGRLDKEQYMKRAWRGYRQVVAVGCVVAAACVMAEIYLTDAFIQYACAFFLLVIPLTIVMFLTEARKAYEYAPWYGLTSEYVFFTLWDSGHEVRRTELNNIVGVDVRGATCDLNAQNKTGTVICHCRSLVPSLMSRTIRFASVEQPHQVEALINHLLSTGATL